MNGYQSCIICEELTRNRVDYCGDIVCWECLESHCKNAINDRKYQIKCPAKDCRRDLPYNYVIRCLNDEEIQQLDKLITDAAQWEEELANKKARCPECRSLCDIESGNTFHCYRCWKRYCSQCMEREHEDEECSLVEVESALEGEGKRCPRCKILIEKREGCDCVRCPHCKCKFCWNCLMMFKFMESTEKHQELCDRFSAFNETEQSDAESE